MDTRFKTFVAAGSVLFAIIVFIDLYFFADLYFSGIAGVILITLGMSFFIMQDSRFLPEVTVFLRDDAKGIIVANKGNDAAKNIHVAVVPHNIEFDVPALAADEQHDHPLQEMISEAKAAVTYQNSRGQAYSQTFRLSALGRSDEDLFKPIIPLFKWK